MMDCITRPDYVSADSMKGTDYAEHTYSPRRKTINMPAEGAQTTSIEIISPHYIHNIELKKIHAMQKEPPGTRSAQRGTRRSWKRLDSK